MTIDTEKPFGIGLYEGSREIPPGKWGYIADAWEPELRIAGPEYMPTLEEQALMDERQQLEREDMNGPACPTTLEMLIALAQPELTDPEQQSERNRIIGSEFVYLGDDDGLSAEITEFGVEEDEEVGQVLVIKCKSEVVFNRNGGSQPSSKETEFRLAVDKIKSFKISSSHDYGINFFYGLFREVTIHRAVKNPRVAELAMQIATNRQAEHPKFRASKAAGDYDPRLGEFFMKVAAEHSRGV